MKRSLNLWVFVMSLLVVLGCNDDETSAVPPVLEGNYEGTFERDDMRSDVTLTLENGEFSGSSNKDRFPAICNGTYTQEDGRATFSDVCVWTADFDWTLILSGEWDVQANADALIMLNENGDKYTLVRK